MSEIDKFLDGDTPKPAAPAKVDPQSSQIDDFLKDAPAPARGLKGWGQDIAATAIKGAIAVPEAIVGLADIPTGGRVGKFLENEGGSVGFRPKEAKAIVNEWHSDATKEAQRKFQAADGIVDKAGVALSNPSLIATAVGESLPSMGLGGVAARGLMAATKLGQMGAKGAVLAGAAGEGATMAGAQAEQIRQETQDGLLTPTQAGLAAATGLVGGAFGVAGGKVAQRLGIGDAETLMAQGVKGMDKQFADKAAQAAVNPLVADAAVKSIPRKVIEGAISEGFLEELPQSMAEQIFQNIALDKPWYDELDSAAVMGVLSGGAMGAGAGGFHGFRESSANGEKDAAAGKGDKLPQLAYNPDPLVVFPDGTVGTQAQVDAYINGLPEGERIPARAALLNQGAQAADPPAQPNKGLARVGQEFAMRLRALQEQEQGEPSVPQTTPPDGAAALAQQQAARNAELSKAQAERDAVTAANRAIESPDDEILQSTGAAPRLSETMGLRSGPEAGSLENAAAMAVDTGAHGQMQEAAALSQAAKAADKGKSATKKQEHPAQYQQEVDPNTGEISGMPSMADWSDVDLSNAFRHAQAKDVRQQLAQELSRRRAARNEVQQQTAQQEQAAAAPGANAEGANVATLAQLNRKKLAEMSDGELQQLSTLLPADHSRQQKIQKAIQARAEQAQAAINKGANADGTQTSQAQQSSAQPAQAGRAQAGQPAVQGLTDAAPAQDNGRKAGATTAPQAQSQEPTSEQRAARIAAAGQQWTRMPTAERSALVARLEGVKPVLAKNMPGAQWDNLNVDIKRKLADVMEPKAAPAVATPDYEAQVAEMLDPANPRSSVTIAANHEVPDSVYRAQTSRRADPGYTMKPGKGGAIELTSTSKKSNPGAAQSEKAPAAIESEAKTTLQTGSSRTAVKQEAQPMADAKPFAAETGTLGIPRADMPQVPTANHGGLVKHLNAQGIAHETTTVDAAQLKPTQAEYSPLKVEAAKSATGDRAVIVSSDGHIIDGHHQAVAAAEEGKQVKAIVLDAPVEKALEAVKASPSANRPQAVKDGDKQDAAYSGSPVARFEQLRAKGGEQAPFKAFGAVAGASGEAYADVWNRWNSVMGFKDAVQSATGEQVLAKMQEQLLKEPYGNDAVYPGDGRGMVADASLQAWRNRADKVAKQAESFSKELDREELRARDAENFGAADKAVSAARAAVAEMRKRAAQAVQETKEGMAKAEVRAKAEDAAEAQAYQDSFEAPSQSVLAKKPTPASITNWSKPTELRGQNFYTNGHFVDATGTPPHIKDWESRIGIRVDIPASQMERVLGLAGVRNGEMDSTYVKAEPLALINDKKQGRMFFDVGGELVAIDLIYAQYFGSKIKGATFTANPNDLNSALRVMDGDKLAGIVMPIRMGADAPSVDDVRGYMKASGKDKPQSVVVRKQAERAEQEPTGANDFPMSEAVQSYSGISHTGRSRAEGDKQAFDKFMEAAQASGEALAETEAQHEAMGVAVEQLRADYLQQYRSLMNVRASTYSGFVAGRGNLNSKQASARNSALDKAMERFDSWAGDNSDRVSKAVLAARTPEQVKADRDKLAASIKERADKKAADLKAQLLKFLRFKSGEEMPYGKNAIITKVSYDRDGYPSSLTFKMADGSAVTNDKVELLPTLKDKDETLEQAKARIRALVDEVRAENPELTKGAGAIRAAASAKASKPAADKAPVQTPHLDRHNAIEEGINAGTLALDDFKSTFAELEANQDAVMAELQKLTKDQLLRAGGPAFAYRMANEKKDAIVTAAYQKMLNTYALGRSYGPSIQILSASAVAKNKAEKAQALRELVENTTAEDLAARAAEIKALRDEYKAEREAAAQALANPKTLQDFRAFMRHWMEKGDTSEAAYLRLTPEQRQSYDAMEAEQTKDSREAAKRSAKASVASAGNTTAGEVIATKHTKHGHDLYVVQLAERVERDAYDTLNSSAKRLGGSYSSYRGNGAVPGFQFRTREAAEAFQKLVGGDTAQAQELANQRRDAFDDDKSQSAAERLRTMAEALDERATEALGVDRKANTARRARFAASAEAAARAQQALAGTMRNIAQAIDSGTAKFLDGVRQRVQVEYLMGQLRAAKSNQLQAKYPDYGERMKRQSEPMDAETVDFAQFPRFEMFRSDLASLARQLLEIDGGKKMGAALEKLADDVTDAYTDWAKANLLRVSHFGNKAQDGFAEFASKDVAERAIKRSGLVGKAVVLQIKRGQNRVILSPGEAMQQGLWQGDGDKRIRLSMDFVEGLATLGKRKGSKVLALPWQLESALENRQRLQRMGIQTPAEFRSALRELASLQQEMATPDRIKELERSMVGRANDGLDFFPTSPAVVQSMLDAAEIAEGMAVLEPSAGMGHIADAIVEETGVWPDVVELSGNRRELLEAKGFHLAEVNDFLQMEPRRFFTFGDTFRAPDGVEGTMRGVGSMGSQRVRLEDAEGKRLGLYDRSELVGVAQNGTWSGYDRIIMNPPFSDGRDIQHVMHAYSLLRPGGRIVAIMGEGAFFHSNKRAEGFREWLDERGATNEKLPDGSFMDPSLPVNTGVAARMVVIDKPAGDQHLEPRSVDEDALNFGDKVAASPMDTFPAELMAELAAVDELFAYPSVHAATAEAALRQVDPSIELVGDVTAEDERSESGADTKLLFRTGQGRDFYVFEKGDELWLDVSRLGEGDGGSAIYAALMDYAATNDKVFIGDPAGLSDIAMRRRLEAMISSAIKRGSTDHIEPHARQVVGDEALGIPALKWHAGDTIGNIQRMIDVSLASISAHVPEFQRARYDFATGAFRTGAGKPLPDGVLLQWSKHPRMRAAGAGRRSIKRGILLNTLLRTEGGQRPGLLEQALRQPGQLVGEQAQGIFYKLGAGSQRRPASAQDKAVMQAIADGKSARDVLRVVASGSKDTFLRQTARLLLKAGITPSIEFGHIGKTEKGDPIHGQYRGKSDTIAMAGSAEYAAERIFMHEAMHAATMRALAKPGLHKLQLQKLLAHVRKQPGAAGFYGISDKNGNVDEFVAEVFTNPDFQAALRKMSAPSGGTIKTAWDGFVRILRSILGLSNDSINALSQALQLGVAAMRVDMVLRKDGARADRSANFGADDFSKLKTSALDQLHQSLSHPGKVSWWDKSFGTMRNLAERVPQFKPVFESAQRFIDDVSMLANDAADAAPRLLPRVETMADLKKKPITAADNKAVAKPLFEGTLMWARDLDGTPVTTEALNDKYRNMPADEKAQIMLRTGKLQEGVLKMWKSWPIEQYEKAISSKFESTILKPGVLWNADELKSLFKLDDKQVGLYQEAREAIDRSLDMTARTDMLRVMGDQFASMRDAVLDQQNLDDAFNLVVETLQAEARANPDIADRVLQMNNAVVKRYEMAKELMDKGYAPLSRFGKYTVDVVGKDGEREYFGMFESMREANQMAMKMRDVFKGATVTQGTMSEQAFKLFAGITPESLEQFGEMLGLKGDGDEAKDKAFQAYLQLAKNNHSALKRLIHRKGIDGYSEDVGRVLASFVYSNARLGAGGLNAGTMENAIEAIPKEMGELRDVAMGLRSYIQDPQEEGQAIRGMLFAQYLGGSVASAMVNMTQPFQITMPWLSQYGGMAKAGKQMARALKDMATKGFKYEPDLAKALKDAEDDGTVSPQEIHQLMAQARGTGSLRTGDGTKLGDARAAASNNWERVKVAWGQPFALAEQFNRRSTFIASYRIAKDQGMADPAEFARKAVLETQFLYSKANKMRFARGAVGGALLTFKTYSVSYLELMHRMWSQGEAGSPERAAGRRAVGWAVAMLLLMSGAGGLPFVEDAEDLIDGAGQLMGYNISAKQWRKQFLADTVGKEFGEFIEQGMSGLPGAPIDVSGRLGLGNLIPGTGLLLTKQNRERDLLEIAGPAGDLVARGFSGARKALTGDFGGAALEAAPTAVRNAAKGIDMATSGIYKDTKGYKVIDTTLAEAAAKFAGFQPKSVSEVQESNSFMQRSKSFYIQTSSEIKAQWASAIFNKDDAALQRVRDRLAAWNRDNPEQPITVKIPDIMKKVREMGKDRTARIADTAPKALRSQMREMAAEASR